MNLPAATAAPLAGSSVLELTKLKAQIEAMRIPAQDWALVCNVVELKFNQNAVHPLLRFRLPNSTKMPFTTI